MCVVIKTFQKICLWYNSIQSYTTIRLCFLYIHFYKFSICIVT